uniref:CSON009675 protein n=1 Tax=Culicoides sonorensis TaxID=179676 RepID=A0A336LHA6_CULSO
MYENGNNYDQEYMEQEEEWEREGLLDPAWEKQQKKVSQVKFYFCKRV